MIDALRHLGWPDIVLGALLLFGLLKGVKRGGVREVGGLIALAAALAAAIFYRGQFDQMIGWISSAGAGVNRLLGVLVAAVLGYLIALLIMTIIDRIMHLPVLGTGNALIGGAIGVAKAALLLWAVLYVALFFPLPSGMRHDLARSPLVGLLTSPNVRIDRDLEAVVPPVAAPYVDPIFRRHELPHTTAGW